MILYFTPPTLLKYFQMIGYRVRELLPSREPLDKKGGKNFVEFMTRDFFYIPPDLEC